MSMRPDQIQALERQLEAAALRLQKLHDTPLHERPTEAKSLRAWVRGIEAEQQGLEQLQRLLNAASPKPPAPSGGRARAQRLAEREAAGHDALVDVIRKPDGAEIHVAVRSWSGGKTIDMRLYEAGPDGELRATRKGLQVDARNLPAILVALTKAQQHV